MSATSSPISVSRVHQFVENAVGEDLHAKRVLSLGNAVAGALTSASLAIHAIGLGLTRAASLRSKHAIKQVDRLVSNMGINVWDLFAVWVPFVVASRPHIVVALDWTEFDDDDQSTIALNMVTRHGRATPLMWQTVIKSEMKDQRNDHEDRLLKQLREVLPAGVGVVLLADRGFGDTKLYALLAELGFDYIIRFRENILVTDAKGITKPAGEWVPPSGRATKIKGPLVTAAKVAVPAVVVAKASGMKDAWCLACSDPQMTASVAVAHYGKRFSIEENFRDTKDIHFGMGLSHTSISKPARRDRLLLISALTVALLTMLGAAGEATGLDAKFKANTSKRRQHSLYRQGWMYYECLVTMRDEWAVPLLEKFEELLAEQKCTREVFGIL
jgi:Transposase DDE domain